MTGDMGWTPFLIFALSPAHHCDPSIDSGGGGSGLRLRHLACDFGCRIHGPRGYHCQKVNYCGKKLNPLDFKKAHCYYSSHDSLNTVSVCLCPHGSRVEFPSGPSRACLSHGRRAIRRTPQSQHGCVRGRKRSLPVGHCGTSQSRQDSHDLVS